MDQRGGDEPPENPKLGGKPVERLLSGVNNWFQEIIIQI